MASAVTPQAATRSSTPDVPKASAPARAKRRVRLSGRAAVLIVVVLLILVAAIAPFRNLMDQRAQLAELNQQTAQLLRQNTELQARIDQLNDPAYLERLARECLGMVHAGEIAFRVIPKHGIPMLPDC